MPILRGTYPVFADSAIQGHFSHCNLEYTISSLITAIRHVEEHIGRGRIATNVSLAPFTTFKIGGPADYFVEARSGDELVAIVQWARATGIPFFLLGVGANILVGDAGFRGLVIRNRADAVSIDSESGMVTAESGAVIFPDLIEQCVSAGLSGLEHFVGIPSTVGGALWQNLHFLSPPPARERTVFIEEVVCGATILTETGEVQSVSRDYFNFGYDYSTLHDTADIVVTADFLLSPAAENRMREIMRANLEWRAARHPPLDSEPSAGSIFKKIAGIGAGRLIDAAGLKGTRIGGAVVTHRHANIMINAGGARAADVVALIEHVQQVVLEHSGYQLETEIAMIGEFVPLATDTAITRD